MFIKKVENFDGIEADVIISDGHYEMKCYYYCLPLSKEVVVGQNVKEIYALLVRDIVRVNNDNILVIKESDYYSYTLQGQVTSIEKPTIGIGEITIILDSSFPKDITIGEYVKLEVKRLDCFL